MEFQLKIKAKEKNMSRAVKMILKKIPDAIAIKNGMMYVIRGKYEGMFINNFNLVEESKKLSLDMQLITKEHEVEEKILIKKGVILQHEKYNLESQSKCV